MSERGLLQEWLDEYGGSTFDGRKPCTPDLEARTRAALAAPEHVAPQASEQPMMGEGEAALPSSMPAGAAPPSTSRNAVIEECAKIADDLRDSIVHRDGWDMGILSRVAYRIRKLKSDTGGEQS